jgi:hypothetical protein
VGLAWGFQPLRLDAPTAVAQLGAVEILIGEETARPANGARYRGNSAPAAPSRRGGDWCICSIYGVNLA